LEAVDKKNTASVLSAIHCRRIIRTFLPLLFTLLPRRAEFVFFVLTLLTADTKQC